MPNTNNRLKIKNVGNQHTVLKIQFRSVNYTLVATICKNFRAKQAMLVVVFNAKAVFNRF